VKIVNLVFFFLSLSIFANSNEKLIWNYPDWSSDFSFNEGENRKNLYNLSSDKLNDTWSSGYQHAYKWPVDITGLYIPYESFKYFLESDDQSPLKKFIFNIAKKQVGFYSLEEFYKWLGLQAFPKHEIHAPSPVHFPNGVRPDYYMGASIIDTPFKAKGLTFSCAACHSQSLFGKPVMGLTNKRPSANEFFMLGKKYIPILPPRLYQLSTKASKAEYELLKRSKHYFSGAGAKLPLVRGLDTSLAQVALSLAKRNKDEYASKSSYYEKHPRRSPLENIPADSKPAVWWNLKYKTRWLSDGSIISGNPILTNFLWNEIGRGTDLKQLESWMKTNKDKVMELSAAVFATEAPRWENFLPQYPINISRAQKGEKIFNNTCKKCHGEYQKAWNTNKNLNYLESLKTTKVVYHEETPVIDVGTDPFRYRGMKYFYKQLNQLKISKWMNAVVVPQEGYVPPPLVGIWSRYPYLHNNAIPTLCDLVTPPSKRTKIFYQGPSDNPDTDFDSNCVGYPRGEKVPKHWQQERYAKFDVSKDGLRNTGHYKMFLNDDGTEKYSWEQKMDLIEFLKTL
jgi:hypothetical protein